MVSDIVKFYTPGYCHFMLPVTLYDDCELIDRAVIEMICKSTPQDLYIVSVIEMIIGFYI
jgi:hypothetical protein